MRLTHYMHKTFHDEHMIILDGEQTHLLCHWVSDNGVILSVSGPEQVLHHEHTVTETDGSPLKLTVEQ